jgi:spoIIIJ-associated protein
MRHTVLQIHWLQIGRLQIDARRTRSAVSGQQARHTVEITSIEVPGRQGDVADQGQADTDEATGPFNPFDTSEQLQQEAALTDQRRPPADRRAPDRPQGQREVITMEWVETTAKSVESAKEVALDRLGVGVDDAEFEVVEEPKPGLFGRVRGQARVRARVKPTPVRPKQERRRRKDSGSKAAGSKGAASKGAASKGSSRGADEQQSGAASAPPMGEGAADSATPTRSQPRPTSSPSSPSSPSTTTTSEEHQMNDQSEPSTIDAVSPEEVGAAAVAFMDGLVVAFGTTGTSSLTVDDTELEVRLDGEGLGLLVGPGGRTLNAVQDLVRVAAQRRLGDHETRLRIDVAGYRVRRQEALTRFGREVAEAVRSSGTARILEPMTSADRKVLHDVLGDEPGVTSRSTGDDPYRKVIVEPTSDHEVPTDSAADG